MNSKETAWIVVRAFGVYLAVQAFFELSHLVYMLQQLYSLHEVSASSSAVDIVKKVETQTLIYWSKLPTSIISFFLLSFLAFYCLRKGAKIHKLLMYKHGETTDT